MTRHWLVAILFLVTVWICIAPAVGDTLNYCSDVIKARQGQWTGSFHPLWEFGHLLWRPTGALLAPVVLWLVPDTQAWTPLLKVAWGLTALNYIAGFFVVMLCYRIMLPLTGSWKASVFLTMVLLWSNGFLIFMQSGSAYVVGLFFEVLAISIQLRKSAEESWRRDILAAGLMAIAALLWFPFILLFPAVAATRWFVKGATLQAGVRQFLRIGIAGALVIGAGIAAGAWMAGARSGAEFSAWYTSAAHGVSQNNQLVRAISGIPRLMLDLTKDGVILKRFVLRDPFQPVSIVSLFVQSLWKVLAFYLLVLAGLIQAWLWRPARPWLGLLALAWIPLLGFSVFLFEPSGPERFLPALPFLILSWAAAWPSGGRRAVIGRVVIVTLASIIILLNTQKFVVTGVSEQTELLARLEELNQRTERGDVMVTVTFADPLVNLIEQRPFQPYNRTRKADTYQLVELANQNAIHWRKAFAEKVFSQWDAHEVWLTKSVRSPAPSAEILWTEGDNPSIKWSDFSGLFSRFDYDSETAHKEGFIRLAKSLRNREMLEKLIQSDSIDASKPAGNGTSSQ